MDTKHKFRTLLVLAGFLLRFASAQTSAVSTGNVQSCSLNAQQLEGMLNLPIPKFDQDESGGWRHLAHQGCELTAAMLIDTFVADAPSRMTVTDHANLMFHAAQLYANANLNALAQRRFLQALDFHEKPDADLAWNVYVLASIAFLSHDRQEFDHQQQLLASAKSTPGNKMNLAVLSRLAHCFSKSYLEAYNRCDAPAK